MAEYIDSICRHCFHSYVCEQFNEHRDSNNKKCHFFNDHFVSAADVVEGKRGRWEKDQRVGKDYRRCSNCKYDFARLYPDNYCPNCGARMEVDHG